MILRKLFQFNLFLSGILLLISVILSFMELTLRNLFYFSFVGIDQIVTYVVIWSTFLGAAYAVSMDSHIKMDLLEQAVSPRLRLFVAFASSILCVVFSVILLISGISLMQESIRLRENTIGVIRIPLWYIQSVIVISALLFLLGSLANTINLARNLLGKAMGTRT